MPHILEAGLEIMEHSNPDGLPKIKGYNIINGQLKLASDESTFLSINPAVLADELGEFPYQQETMCMTQSPQHVQL